MEFACTEGIKSRCVVCNQIKDISEFYYRNDNNKYRTSCKDCWKIHQRNNRKTPPIKKTLEEIFFLADAGNGLGQLLWAVMGK